MKRFAVLLLVAGLGACATETVPPGAGWSRASNLSAYSAMTTYAAIAREQSILCGGFSPGLVARRWHEDYGAREAAVAAALAARHGAELVGQVAATPAATRRVPCPDLPTLDWRYRYARLLRLLEMRLGLA